VSFKVTSTSGPAPPTHKVPLGVTTYEKVSSIIIALLVLLGATVAAMFIVVVTMRALAGTQQPVTVTIAEEGLGRGDHEAGIARDAKNTQVDELDEFFPPEMTEPIDALSTVISADMTVLESLDDPLATFGSGTGQGDSRPAGPPGEGEGDVVPRWERWQVRFSSADLTTYARQLDFFNIELAAMGGGKEQVDYASQLSQPRPTRRAGPSAQEKRLYMTWRSGEMIEADKTLLTSAGIDISGRVILQLYPPETETLLAELEQKQLGQRPLKDVRRTVFGIREQGQKFEFYVIAQEYRFVP
jgi:hypothetical protein